MHEEDLALEGQAGGEERVRKADRDASVILLPRLCAALPTVFSGIQHWVEHISHSQHPELLQALSRVTFQKQKSERRLGKELRRERELRGYLEPTGFQASWQAARLTPLPLSRFPNSTCKELS